MRWVASNSGEFFGDMLPVTAYPAYRQGLGKIQVEVLQVGAGGHGKDFRMKAGRANFFHARTEVDPDDQTT